MAEASDKSALAPAYLIAGTDEAKIDAARRPPARPRRARGRRRGARGLRAGARLQRRARRRGAGRRDPGDVADRERAATCSPTGSSAGRRSRSTPVAEALAGAAAGRHRRPGRPRAAAEAEGAEEARRGGRGRGRRGARLRGAEAARPAAAGWSPRPGGAASSSSPTRRGCWSSGWARRPSGWRPSSTGWRSGPGRRAAVTRADLEAMIADTSEEVAWALSDAIVDRDPASALAAAERLADQGEAVTPLIYQAAKRLREAHRALELLEQGMSPKRGRGGRCRCTPTRRRCSSAGSGVAVARAASGGDLRDRRPRVVDARRRGLPGARGADARGAPRRGSVNRRAARRRTAMRAARDFLRAPVLRCSAPFWTALSIRETSALCSASDGGGVARGDRGLEAAEVGLDRAREAAVLVVARAAVRTIALLL